MQPYAIMFRNQQDKQLFDVAIIDSESYSRIVLNKVSFELASLYVQDYNQCNEITE